ncbi:hypothetical protein [Actinokineospora globicatena]|uniref:Uncharacterized protein n=1 Tax=Actinokineospora globicatena TaxID=103729 RepID=A0A9W6QK73_9PSEU|nr:hypothetical protein [Actinokineospora globicatena]GLW82354.1 hypothetical protein Aglo01_68350 [Actinokineospora globicatena]GLW89181.1 hypothetical protein Aglo02_68200 [Actinokineospora globicatena]GLW92536.1 hypothetical protein Aglo03_33520 [Actinokineospora globicatena]
MSDVALDKVPAIVWADLVPYASVVFLEVTDRVGPLAGRMATYLATPCVGIGGQAEVLAAGQLTAAEMTSVAGMGSIVEEGFEEIAAVIRRADRAPLFAGTDLTVALRRRRLVAVHCADPAMRDQLLAWVDQTPSLGLRRVSSWLIEQAVGATEALVSPEHSRDFEDFLYRLSERMDLIEWNLSRALIPAMS